MIQASAISVQNTADPSVSPIGLTSAEASRRLGEIGPNAVSEDVPPRWRRFLAKFSAPIAWMLEAAIVQTFAFVTLLFGSQGLIYVLRERRRIWSSTPSKWVLASSAVDIQVTIAVIKTAATAVDTAIATNIF